MGRRDLWISRHIILNIIIEEFVFITLRVYLYHRGWLAVLLMFQQEGLA
jgi:hypothetical protein